MKSSLLKGIVCLTDDLIDVGSGYDSAILPDVRWLRVASKAASLADAAFYF